MLSATGRDQAIWLTPIEVTTLHIPTYKLKSGYDMPILGLGTWPLNGEECTLAVSKALEMGYSHIDTADVYGNHIEVGKGLANFDRAGLFVTSKVGPEKLGHDALIATCERSLDELDLDYLDMYLLHWPNPDIPMEETFGALKQLHDGGKLRSIGVSNFIIERLAQAIEISELPICTNQVEFHPLLYQEELLQFCKEKGVPVTAYCPLGRTEALHNEVIGSIAEQYEKTPAQVCLRWLVQKGIIVIPKTRSEERMKQNMEIFDWELSAEAEQCIDNIPEEKRVVRLSIAEF